MLPHVKDNGLLLTCSCYMYTDRQVVEACAFVLDKILRLTQGQLPLAMRDAGCGMRYLGIDRRADCPSDHVHFLEVVA